MAIEILSESRLRIGEAAKRIGVNVSTTWRWVLRGVRGHKLESALVGGQRFTSIEALERFVTKINTPAGITGSVRTPKQREKAVAAAEQALINACGGEKDQREQLASQALKVVDGATDTSRATAIGVKWQARADRTPFDA